VEGTVMVLNRVHHLHDYELFFNRYLEDDGGTLRLVIVHKNLLTG
jgi:hypothetical protein